MGFGLTKLFSQLHTNTSSVPKQVVGIDLGSSSIKVVEIEQKENILTLKTYGELQLGPYADMELGKATRLPVEKQTEALVDVLRESNVTAHSGVMTLQLSTSFVTVFGITAKENDDIGPRVRVEARKYIPVPLTDVTLDWSELPPLGDESSLVREVLVAAVQNDARAETFQLLQAVQMSSQPTEIELFSILRAVSKTTDESIAIVDLGAQTSKLYIAHQGIVRKIHRVFVGGTQATQRIATQLHLTFEEAENQKRNYTSDNDNAAEIKKIVVSTFERPLQEFKRVIGQYETRSGTSVSRVIVGGGSAAFAEMQAYVGYMFDRPVEKANPFTKVAYPAFMEDTLIDIAPTFSVALGAALRPFEVVE